MDIDYQYIDIDDVDKLDGPLYVLVTGTMGAGKSTVIGKHIKSIPIMDIDDVIAEVGNGVYDRANALTAHEIISKRIFHMMDRRESFVAMGTGASVYGVVERLANAKEMGYKTALLYVYAPVNQALEQNRHRINNGERGVKLDEEHKIIEAHKLVENTVHHLKHTRLLDYIVEYDNTRDL